MRGSSNENSNDSNASIHTPGHGGNLIVLLHEFDMIVVTAADPLYELPGDAGWRHEGAIIDLVGKFVESLPKE
jgi:hypothetical protein